MACNTTENVGYQIEQLSNNNIKISSGDKVVMIFLPDTMVIDEQRKVIRFYHNASKNQFPLDYNLINKLTLNTGADVPIPTQKNDVINLLMSTFFGNYVTAAISGGAISGNIETPSLVEYLTDESTDQCLACSLFFRGTGGTLEGVTVPDNFTVTYGGSLRNQLSPIDFTVPTAGEVRVLVAYTFI